MYRTKTLGLRKKEEEEDEEEERGYGWWRRWQRRIPVFRFKIIFFPNRNTLIFG